MGIGPTINNTPHSMLASTLSGDLAMGRSGTVNFAVLATEVVPDVGNRISIFDSSPVSIFGGVITNVVASRVGAGPSATTLYQVTAQSWEHRFALGQCGGKVYNAVGATQMNAEQVLTDVINTYANGELYFLTSGEANIQDGLSAANLGQISFAGKSVLDACLELAERCGYYFYITSGSYIKFIPKDDGVPGGPTIDAANSNYAEPVVTQTTQDYFNKVRLAISWAAFAPSVKSITGNGVLREWTLDYDVDHVVTVTLNGVEATVGAEGDTDVQFWVSYGTNKFKQNTDDPVLSNTDTVEVTYHRIDGNIVTVENTSDIAARASADGGSGILEAPVIEDDAITTVQAATKRGEGFLAKHMPRANGAPAGTPPSTYSFKFRSYGVDGSKILPGYIITLAWTNPSSGGTKTLIVNSVTFKGAGYKFWDKSATDWDVDGYIEYDVTAIEYVPLRDDSEYIRALTSGNASSSGIRVTGAPGGGGSGTIVPAGTVSTQALTLTQALTTITPSVAAAEGTMLTVLVKQDAIGGRDVDWSSGFKLAQSFKIDYLPNTWSVFTFAGRTDGKWWLSAHPITGVAEV